MTRILLVLFCLAGLGTTQVQAQSLVQGQGVTQPNRTPSHCIALANAAPGLEFLHFASYTRPVAPESVRLHYIWHSQVLIQTPGGLSAITDYTGFTGGSLIPDVVTMNRAHETHYTSNPNPLIPHVLPGWGPIFGEGIDHHLELGEMLVRNVSTDIRSEWSRSESKGNSIFIFEVAGLCIGHVGHLHHEPNEEQYAAIGRLDVAMVPVDGGQTLDRRTLKRMLNRLRSSVVIPVHWRSELGLGAFLDEMRESFDIVPLEQPDITLSLNSLPTRPTIMVLQPAYLSDGD